MAETVTITETDDRTPLTQWRDARTSGKTPHVAHDTVPLIETPAAPTDVEPPEPEPTAPTGERWSDPETGEVLDMRTRRAKRIKALWQKTKDLESKIADLSKRPTELPREQTPPAAGARPQADPVPSHDDPEPQESDFPNDWAKFLSAHAGWTARQEVKKAHAADKSAAREETFKREFQAAYHAYRDKAEVFAKTTPDFDAVVSQDVALTPVMQHAVITSDHGPQIAYWLGKHPDQAAQLRERTAMSGPEHMALVRDLLERLAVPPPSAEPPPPALSKAPPPVKTLEGAPVTTPLPSKDFGQMSLADYKARRRAG